MRRMKNTPALIAVSPQGTSAAVRLPKLVLGFLANALKLSEDPSARRLGVEFASVSPTSPCWLPDGTGVGKGREAAPIISPTPTFGLGL